MRAVLDIVERVEGIDPERFWSGRPAAARWRSMSDKYAKLARIARMPDDPGRKVALRDAAKRWPGSLREAELIGPERVDLRLREARHAGQVSGISRRELLARGAAAAAVAAPTPPGRKASDPTSAWNHTAPTTSAAPAERV